jgi:hypothetical protein
MQLAERGAFLLHFLLALGLGIEHGDVCQIRIDGTELPAGEGHIVEHAAAVCLKGLIDGLQRLLTYSVSRLRTSKVRCRSYCPAISSRVTR